MQSVGWSGSSRWSATLASISLVCALATAQDRPPNVVVIMADDMGWTDLGCQGNLGLDTPNLDRLAADGVRFTDAYAAAPVCSPVRAAMLTGLAPARLGITNHIADQRYFLPPDAKLLPAPMLDHLPLKHETLAERLKGAGYATQFIGKWHLAGLWRHGEGRGDTEFYPEHQGFDRNIGGCAYGGPPTFFDPYGIHTLPSRREGEYLPDRLADESIAFVEENKERPFFLCLWPYAVHWPMEAPEDLVRKYVERRNPRIKDPRYAAMIEAFDRSLGRLFDALDEAGLRDDTLVIFTSDNGPYLGVAEPRPLREGKGYLYEGGIRVPMIIRWPRVVKPGRLTGTPTITMDVLPTVLEAAGIDGGVEPCDGVSLMPLLRGEDLDPRPLYWHYPNYAFHRGNRLGAAIRVGEHKLIRYFDDSPPELYNVEVDIGESRDLAAKKPELRDALLVQLDAWLDQVGAQMPIARR